MQALYNAQRLYDECKGREAELEQQLVVALEAPGRGNPDAVLSIEQQLEGCRATIAEALIVVDYFRQKGEQAIQSDLYRLVYHSRHPSGTTPHTKDEMMSLATRWSESNAKRSVTGIWMSTGMTHFGILEGPHAEVTGIFNVVKRDVRHVDCTLLSCGKVEAREYVFGLKLHIVEDELIAAVLEKAQDDIVFATRFAPPVARDVVAKGGDPEGIVADIRPEAIAVAVLLDSLCGAQHSAASYAAATKSIEAIVDANGGTVTEGFGEVLLCVFPITHGTQAITAAKAIGEAVMFSIVAVATGSMSMVAAPHCWALGGALMDAKALVFLAEADRRSLIVTEKAMDRCSKAHHKFLNITIDAKVYYTLQSIGDARLGLGQDAETDDPEVPQYSGLTAVITEGSNVTQYRTMTHQEHQDKLRGDAVVRGALTKNTALDYFRSLDPGNVGWVSKEAVKKWLLSGSGPYQLFEEYEMKGIVNWMAKHNAIGNQFLNFEEFSMLCLKLEQR